MYINRKCPQIYGAYSDLITNFFSCFIVLAVAAEAGSNVTVRIRRMKINFNMMSSTAGLQEFIKTVSFEECFSKLHLIMNSIEV